MEGHSVHRFVGLLGESGIRWPWFYHALRAQCGSAVAQIKENENSRRDLELLSERFKRGTMSEGLCTQAIVDVLSISARDRLLEIFREIFALVCPLRLANPAFQASQEPGGLALVQRVLSLPVQSTWLDTGDRTPILDF